MARRALPSSVYTLLMQSYREHPGRHVIAAKAAGVGYLTAVKAWTKGLRIKNCPEAAVPLSKQLGDEQEAARAAFRRREEDRRRQAEEMHEQARQDAITARAEEAGIVRTGRTTAAQLLDVVSELVKGAVPVAAGIRACLEQLAPDGTSRALDGKGRPLSMVEQIRVLNSLGVLAQRSYEVAKVAMEMERLHLGQAEQIIGIAGQDLGEDLSFEEAEREVEAAQVALRRAREKRELRVVNGGLDLSGEAVARGESFQ